MGKKGKIASFKKIEVIKKYLRGEDSLNHLAEVINVSYASIKQWLQTYLSLETKRCGKNTVIYETEILEEAR